MRKSAAGGEVYWILVDKKDGTFFAGPDSILGWVTKRGKAYPFTTSKAAHQEKCTYQNVDGDFRVVKVTRRKKKYVIDRLYQTPRALASYKMEVCRASWDDEKPLTFGTKEQAESIMLAFADGGKGMRVRELVRENAKLFGIKNAQGQYLFSFKLTNKSCHFHWDAKDKAFPFKSKDEAEAYLRVFETKSVFAKGEMWAEAL